MMSEAFLLYYSLVDVLSATTVNTGSDSTGGMVSGTLILRTHLTTVTLHRRATIIFPLYDFDLMSGYGSQWTPLDYKNLGR